MPGKRRYSGKLSYAQEHEHEAQRPTARTSVKYNFSNKNPNRIKKVQKGLQEAARRRLQSKAPTDKYKNDMSSVRKIKTVPLGKRGINIPNMLRGNKKNLVYRA